jgi:hypothetical protein
MKPATKGGGRHETIFSYLLWCFVVVAVGQAQNWPSFRGHKASGVADGRLPAKVGY